jgi:hypothetical protein
LPRISNRRAGAPMASSGSCCSISASTWPTICSRYR